MAKLYGLYVRFFRPSPQRLNKYLSGLQGLPIKELNQQLTDLYSAGCCSHHIELPNLSAEDDMAKQLAAMVQQIWKDKALPEGLINKEVTSEFAKRLWAGVTEGYGNPAKEFNAGKIDYDTPDFKMLAALQKNTWQFAAAKNYTQLRELGNALIGGDGKLRTYSQFKEAAYAINDKHINQWLKAEYELAVAGGQMAGKWVDIEANQDTLRLLEFDAVMDGRTTEICKPLNGVLLPVNDPFWDMYYPPNHWGCRSTVRQRTGGAVTSHHLVPHADIPKMFQTNLAKQGLIFPESSAYFIGLPAGVNEIASIREYLKQISYNRTLGKKVFVEGIGIVEITKDGIDKCLSQKISPINFDLKNNLVPISHLLLANADNVEVLTNKRDPRLNVFKTNIKGLKNFNLIVKEQIVKPGKKGTIGETRFILYSITSK